MSRVLLKCQHLNLLPVFQTRWRGPAFRYFKRRGGSARNQLKFLLLPTYYTDLPQITIISTISALVCAYYRQWTCNAYMDLHSVCRSPTRKRLCKVSETSSFGSHTIKSQMWGEVPGVQSYFKASLFNDGHDGKTKLHNAFTVVHRST